MFIRDLNFTVEQYHHFHFKIKPKPIDNIGILKCISFFELDFSHNAIHFSGNKLSMPYTSITLLWMNSLLFDPLKFLVLFLSCLSLLL